MEKIILDCDPGHDDAIAMMIAAAHPNIELLGVTTVAGNQTVDKTTRNALSVCAIGGFQVPVARGCDRPMIQPQVIADDIHGETGLDGPTLPDPVFDLDPRHAIDFIIDTVMEHEPGTVHLVPVGPLTNIGMAMRKEPRIVERVKSVCLMGGAYTRGNSTPTAEFNIFADPEAASDVFRGAWPVTMVGLDLTHQALATQEMQDRVRAVGGDLAQFVLDIWEFVSGTHFEYSGLPAAAIHDACCVAYLADSKVFTSEKAHVDVELRGDWTRGMTVTNFANVPGMRHTGIGGYGLGDATTDVAMQLDWPRFADIIVDSIRTLTEAKQQR